jgi:hypothetical protein
MIHPGFEDDPDPKIELPWPQLGAAKASRIEKEKFTT